MSKKLSERMRDYEYRLSFPDPADWADEVAALELSEANLKLANEEARKTMDRLSALVPREANESAENSPNG